MALSQTETIGVRLWQVKRTEKAILFSTLPERGAPNREARQIWLPLSQIEHISRTPSERPDGWPECQVTIPLWLCDEKGL